VEKESREIALDSGVLLSQGVVLFSCPSLSFSCRMKEFDLFLSSWAVSGQVFLFYFEFLFFLFFFGKPLTFWDWNGLACFDLKMERKKVTDLGSFNQKSGVLVLILSFTSLYVETDITSSLQIEIIFLVHNTMKHQI
jgi:hypothetical protein